jgi:hypothetical protein
MTSDGVAEAAAGTGAGVVFCGRVWRGHRSWLRQQEPTVSLAQLERLDRVMRAELAIEAIEESTGRVMTDRHRALFGDLYADCDAFRRAVAVKFGTDD